MNKIGMELFRDQFADSPSTLAWVEANFSDADSDLVQKLLDEVDESDYSLRQWIDALVVLGHWMDARALTARLEDQIGYVGCACAAAGASANLTPLSGLVADMLESYGFECAEKRGG
jgi:hypothetical protein